jgi:hypothetical protein
MFSSEEIFSSKIASFKNNKDCAFSFLPLDFLSIFSKKFFNSFVIVFLY